MILKILSSKSKTVIVLSSSGNGCPRIIMGNIGSARLRDDYCNTVSINKKLLKKLISS